ncbi:MAG: HpcH/HpaI aldolase/citrate lyase family protein [Gammaproteobacteria bacterium]
MRSKLFVPGSRPELFAKALAGQADAISFDLEDSVAESAKAAARAQVAAFLETAATGAGKTLIVRVNASSTAHFAEDLRAVVRPGLALLNLPKCESADDVRAAAAMLERVEAATGIAGSVRILANIETPRGLRSAAAIAAAHPRVAGLQVGYLDLFGPQGIDRRDAAAVHAVLLAVRMAAGEAGLFALDGAWPDLADEAGFGTEAQVARRLGYLGKSCIHPRQVGIANAVFQPTAEEIAHAMRVLEAAAGGHAAFELGGRMIDAPEIRRAEALVALSHRVQTGRA